MSQYLLTLLVYAGLLLASKLSFYIYKKIKSNSFELFQMKLTYKWFNFKSAVKLTFHGLFNDTIKFP
ncbi:hypothetical protein MARI151_30052 [Maribacter litoralis]|uniref:Uncharacterized protein n=1 Tax=Maribacter litoralis TaxID=2059726 RepID=A0A653RPZ1_9FLAO|nr:hypothetical protein MARI151_30052 [Maribacter litoralis]